MRKTVLITVLFCIALQACNWQSNLPVYGPKTAVTKTENGKQVIDSLDYVLPPFQFVDQDSNVVNTSTVKGKIYVADFFFTSCPSICPKMMKEMLLVRDKYKDNKDVVILSYSIDPVRDSVARLKIYETKLGITSAQWHFLTGNKDSIYYLANKYLVSASEDPSAPGGHIHDGNFILVDRKGRLRGYYDGTNEQSVQKLLSEMDILLKEKNNE